MLPLEQQQLLFDLRGGRAAGLIDELPDDGRIVPDEVVELGFFIPVILLLPAA